MMAVAPAKSVQSPVAFSALRIRTLSPDPPRSLYNHVHIAKAADSRMTLKRHKRPKVHGTKDRSFCRPSSGVKRFEGKGRHGLLTESSRMEFGRRWLEMSSTSRWIHVHAIT